MEEIICKFIQQMLLKIKGDVFYASGDLSGRQLVETGGDMRGVCQRYRTERNGVERGRIRS
jgi:hypothetical protein